MRLLTEDGKPDQAKQLAMDFIKLRPELSKMQVIKKFLGGDP